MTKGLRQLRRARAEKLLVVGDREIQLDPRSHVSRVSIRDSRRPIDRASSSNRRPACRFRPTRGPAPTHETAAGRVRAYVECHLHFLTARSRLARQKRRASYLHADHDVHAFRVEITWPSLLLDTCFYMSRLLMINLIIA
jgi:hypothetical protein